VDPNDINRIDASSAPISARPVTRPAGRPVEIPPSGTFRSVLEQQRVTGEPVKFSQHAMQRLASRNIQLSNDDRKRINEMTDKAAAKGAKQSLFMLRDVAMVVSIKNRTVITAVDQNSMKENVFTNIDSAAII
jgi:flagellar operon protein